MMEEKEDQVDQARGSEPSIKSDAQPGTAPMMEEVIEEGIKPKRRLRRFLLWIVSLIVIFAAGVLLTWTLRVQPQAAQITELEAEIASAQKQISSQENELSDLRPLVKQNASLVEELAATQVHLDILDVLVDVTTAQLALAQEDEIAAKAALEGTDMTLTALESTLEDANSETVREMNGRLQLVRQEVEDDSFAARRDLEIMANNLLALERVLFGE